MIRNNVTLYCIISILLFSGVFFLIKSVMSASSQNNWALSLALFSTALANFLILYVNKTRKDNS